MRSKTLNTARNKRTLNQNYFTANIENNLNLKTNGEGVC